MRVGYLVDEDQLNVARPQMRALTARGHDVQLLDAAGDGFDIVVGRDVQLADSLSAARIVDDEFYMGKPFAGNEHPRVLLAGSTHVEASGIEDGYGAAAHARWFHQKFDLIRVSPWAPSREEPLEAVQEFHVGLDVSEMARLVRTCDVVIGPSRPEDVFNAVPAQAMAAGLAAVLTSIPAHQAFDADADYALFAPPENAVELGERLIEVLGDRQLRDSLRARARTVAERWRTSSAGDRLEAFFVERIAARQR